MEIDGKREPPGGRLPLFLSMRYNNPRSAAYKASPLGGSCRRSRLMRGQLSDVSPSSGARGAPPSPQGRRLLPTTKNATPPKQGSVRLSINLTGRLRTFGRFVGNGLDRSVQYSRQHDVLGNSAPFGAILCAARSQRCGWVKTHPYITTRKRAFSTN